MITSGFFAPTRVVSYFTNKSGSKGEIEGALRQTNHIAFEMQQVHGNSFAWVTTTSATNTPTVDALLTTDPSCALMVRTADCLPILLFHPSGVVGALHAGRKSTRAKLLYRVLEHLQQDRQITNGLELWFGPAICSSCYQINAQTDEHFDLIAANQKQLAAAYPKSAYTLTVDTTCTRCTSDKYYSYRVEGAGVGMNYAAIGL